MISETLEAVEQLIGIVKKSAHDQHYKKRNGLLLGTIINLLIDLRDELNKETVKENKIPEPYLYPSVKNEYGNIYTGKLND